MKRRPENRPKKRNAKQTRKRTISPRSGADITAYQFQPGGDGGPGRKNSRALREAILAEVETKGGLAPIIGALYRKALRGDVQSAKLILEFTHGKAPLADDEPTAPAIVRFVWADDPSGPDEYAAEAETAPPPKRTLPQPTVDASVHSEPEPEIPANWATTFKRRSRPL